MRRVNKILSLLLALVMVAGLIPTLASAEEVSETWTKVDGNDLSSLSATDTIAITMTTSDETVYLLPSTAYTASKGPTAVEATVTNEKLVADSATYGWNVTAVAGGYTFTNNDGKYLYSTNANAGVRVSNTVDVWHVDSTTGYLVESNNTRYLGVYTDNPDWRAYLNTTGNIKDQTLTIWKLDKTTASLFYGQSLTLDGSIGVNFYVDLSGVDATQYTMDFTIDKTTTTVNYDTANDRVLNGKTYQRFTVSLTSVQMDSVITATLKCDGTAVETHTYSVYQYARDAIAKNRTSNQNLKDLCAALLNYGSYAQTYFSAEENLPNKDLSTWISGWSDPVAGSWDVDLSGYTSETTGTKPSALTGDFAGSLILESETVIRFYFNASDLAGLAFTVNGGSYINAGLTPQETASGDEGYGTYSHYVEFSVPSNELSQTFTVTVTDSDNAYSVTCSAFYYVGASTSGATDLANLCKALYYYGTAADAYFD